MLVCQVFRAFTAVMKNCPITREWFERRVGHYRLTQLVSTITQPSINLLQEAMNMVSPFSSLSLTLSFFSLPSLPDPLFLSLSPSPYELNNAIFISLPSPPLHRLLKAPTSTNKTVTLSTTRRPSRCFFSGFPRWPRPSSAGWQGDSMTFAPVAPRTSSVAAREVC